MDNSNSSSICTSTPAGWSRHMTKTTRPGTVCRAGRVGAGTGGERAADGQRLASPGRAEQAGGTVRGWCSDRSAGTGDCRGAGLQIRLVRSVRVRGLLGDVSKDNNIIDVLRGTALFTRRVEILVVCQIHKSFVYSCMATVLAARRVVRWLYASKLFCFVHTDLPFDLPHKFFSVGSVPGGPSTD